VPQVHWDRPCRVTVHPDGQPEATYFVARGRLAVEPRYRDVTNELGMVVDVEHTGAKLRLTGELVPPALMAPPPPPTDGLPQPERDRRRLADAVQAGDDRAALLLADLVQEAHPSGASPASAEIERLRKESAERLAALRRCLAFFDGTADQDSPIDLYVSLKSVAEGGAAVTPPG
jgi:hypothetical protein